MTQHTFIGLDVHARSVAAGLLDAATGEVRSCSAPAAGSAELVPWLHAQGESIAVAEKTGLVRARGAGNVYVCKPLDPVVFEGTLSADEVACAALAQVIVDCLTGLDRMSAEGEAVLEWMAANEESRRLDA